MLRKQNAIINKFLIGIKLLNIFKSNIILRTIKYVIQRPIYLRLYQQILSVKNNMLR